MSDESDPVPTEKTAREGGRARILDAARELFETKGAAGLSMRALAARAGMATMTVYGYFPSKTAVIRGLWSLAFGPLFQEMRAAENATAEPRARLLAVAKVYVDYWLRHPDRYRMVFLVEDRREKDDGPWFIDQTDVVASYLRFGPLIAAARGQPQADCIPEAEALICSLTGIAHLAITVSEYPWKAPADYIRTIVGGFIRP